jgi:exosome complex component RRP41
MSSSSSSLRRTDILALSHLREDGRRPGEIRRVRIQMGPTSSGTSASSGSCAGSAVVEMGLTAALATVRGPTDCARRSDELPDRAFVEVSVAVAPFGSSGGDRRAASSSSDRRLAELSNLLKRSVEAAVLLHLFPKSRIEISVLILSDDGSRLCAAINAASLALVDAGIPMRDLVCACSAGYCSSPGAGVGGTGDMTLVDLNRREEGTGGPGQQGAAISVPCAMLPQRGTLVMAQSEARVPNFDAMERVLLAAQDGCLALFEIMQAAIRERSAALLKARSGRGRVLYSFAPAPVGEP